MVSKTGASVAKKLGLTSILLLGINGIIGSGIFLLPNKAYAEVGVSSVFVIIVGAILVISLALCYAEASSKFNQNGASYVYAKAAFGDLVGFEVGFYTWVVGVLGWAGEIAALLLAIQSVYPPLRDKITYNIVAICLCFALAIINYFGLNFSKIFNTLSSLGKLIPLVLFVAIGLFFMHTQNFTPFVPEIDTSIETYGTHFGAAFAVIFYAYLGFEFLPIAAGNMENPQKNLPKAIITVVLFCAAFYTLITVVCIGILGPNLANTSVPVASATGAFLGKIGYDFITLGTIISIAGICWSYSFNTPLVAAALSDNGFLPKFVAKKSKFGTPGWAILITALVVAFLVTTGGFLFLAAVNVVAAFVEYIPTALSIPFLRKKKDLPQNYRIPLGPVIPIFAVVISIVMLSQAGVRTIVYGLSGLIVGAIIYYAYGRHNINLLQENKTGDEADKK